MVHVLRVQVPPLDLAQHRVALGDVRVGELDEAAVHLLQELPLRHARQQHVGDPRESVHQLLHFELHVSVLFVPSRTGVHVEEGEVLRLRASVADIDVDRFVDGGDPVEGLSEDQLVAHHRPAVLPHQEEHYRQLPHVLKVVPQVALRLDPPQVSPQLLGLRLRQPVLVVLAIDYSQLEAALGGVVLYVLEAQLRYQVLPLQAPRQVHPHKLRNLEQLLLIWF